MDNSSARRLLYTFLMGGCLGATIIMVLVAYLVMTGKAPWLTAAGVGTGAPDVNARYLDGYGTAVTTSAASKVLITDSSGYLPDSSVDSGAIVDGTIAAADISSSAGITSAQIADGTITSADVNSNLLIQCKRTSTAVNGTYCGSWAGCNTACVSNFGSGWYMPDWSTTKLKFLRVPAQVYGVGGWDGYGNGVAGWVEYSGYANCTHWSSIYGSGNGAYLYPSSGVWNINLGNGTTCNTAYQIWCCPG